MRPLSFLRSLPLFFIPSLVMAGVVYGTVPLLDRLGLPLIWIFTSQVCITLGGLGIAALWAANRDRAPGQRLSQRLRLTPLKVSDLGIGLTVGILGLGAYIALGPEAKLFAQALHYAPPQWLSRFFTHGRFLDVEAAGAWWLVPTYLLIYLCNVVGEELWWRGYILPRQIAGMGSFAWFAQAILWCAFHSFLPSDLVVLLPIAMLIALCAQWRKSTWIGLVAHGVLNLPPFVFLIRAIVG